MSKDKISDYSETPGNNTDIGGINIAEGMLPSDVNNAIREQMAQLKKFQSGTSGESVTFVTANVTTANAGQVNVDNLRLDGNTLSSTNTNGDIELTPNGNGRVTTPALSATSPRVITAINDTNGNELFGVTATGSAVNEFTVANAATGNAPTLSATGGDTNIGMALTPKGTGGVIFPAGAVGTPAITTTGDLNTGIFFPAADTIAFTEGGAEAMRIDSSGNTGIGTSSPRSLLNAMGSGSTGAVLTLENSNTAVTTNDVVGKIDFYSNDTSSPGAGAKANIVGLVTSSGGTSVGLTFGTSDSGSATAVERMRIDSSGNVGIGTSSPSAPLVVNGPATVAGSILLSVAKDNGNFGATDFYQYYASTSDYGLNFGLSVSNATNGRAGIVLRSTTAGNGTIVFNTNNTERARITSGGYFKASNNGTYNDSTGIYHELINSANNHAALIEGKNASQTISVMVLGANRNTTNGTFNFLQVYNRASDTTRLLIADSGNVTNVNGTYGTISDLKLKQDIVDAGSQWDDIKNLRFRKYRLKSDVETNPDAKPLLGLVAQEAELVSPGLIEEQRDTKQETKTREIEKTREVEVTPAVLDEDGNVVEPAVMETETYTETEEYTETVDLGTTTKAIKTSILYMKAVKALQEAMERIETLEAKVAALESKE